MVGRRKAGRMSAASEARDWLNANGINVGPRGRIPKDKLQVYEAHLAQQVRGARGAGENSIKRPTGKVNPKGWTCGFCTPGFGSVRGCCDRNARCPGSVRNGSAISGQTTCRCSANEHPESWPLAWPKEQV
jgi:hypothetical protein